MSISISPVIIVHLFDVIATPRNGIPPAMIPEIYKTMLNVSVTATISPDLFSPEICSSGIPQIPPFDISNSLHLPVRLIYCRFTSPEQRQHSLKTEDIEESSISEALSTLNNHKPNEKDVILLSILHGIFVWKKFLGNVLLLLTPANVVNMSLKSIRGIWEGFQDFPLNVDLDSFHRGIGKDSKDTLPLIRAVKNTVLPLKKHSKLISQANFFEDLYSVDKSEIWNFMLNSLLILSEYELAKNLISLQRDVTLSNLILLQIELGSGKISEALTVANLLISNSDRKFNSKIFKIPCLIENCFVSTPILSIIPYISLIQTHLNFLILCKNQKLNNENGDFILGNILIVAQVLDKHNCGKTIVKFIAEILEEKVSLSFEGYFNEHFLGKLPIPRVHELHLHESYLHPIDRFKENQLLSGVRQEKEIRFRLLALNQAFESSIDRHGPVNECPEIYSRLLQVFR